MKVCGACGEGHLTITTYETILYENTIETQIYTCDFCGSELCDQELLRINLEKCREVIGPEKYRILVDDAKFNLSRGEK